MQRFGLETTQITKGIEGNVQDGFKARFNDHIVPSSTTMEADTNARSVRT